MIRKFLFISIVLASILFVVDNNEITQAEDCVDNLRLESVNSKYLFDYIIDNKLKAISVCSNNYCEELDGGEETVNNFIEKYLDQIENNYDNDTYEEIRLKGFKIDKLRIRIC